ncbi:MAG: hypothetical protein DRI37_06405 [Chloroflexi bacterium]|nr:MAG: hypothetical protein DRI37_06405 [Chloroflexota bacterium]
MRNTTIPADVLVLGGLVICLITLIGCRGQPAQMPAPLLDTAVLRLLPEPIQELYHWDTIFTITWFERPFVEYATYLAWNADGYISRMQISHRGEMGGRSPTQLPDEVGEEIPALLEAMTHEASADELAGSRVITINFLWRGKNHILTFDELSCPDELRRLVEITDAAFGSAAYPNPCQAPGAASRGGTSTAAGDLPSMVKDLHSASLFNITWYTQPFTGSYNHLLLFTDYYRGDNVIDYVYGEVYRGVSTYSQLSESERQEVESILESMTSASTAELPDEDTVITLGFSWEADYHLLSYGNSSCPDELRRLFEIVGVAFDRSAPGYDVLQSPCQGR